jgi:hypothetical protein
MTLYTVRGSSVYVGSELDTAVYKSLPVQTYVVSFNPMAGQFYLTVAPEFELPSKLYGDTETKARRFLTTFADRPAVTGVLLSGAKGSGKSLAMKLTSVLGLKEGIPTLIVSSAYCGEEFNKFVQSIDQACIMIFDEFEKIYDEEHQEQLLTLFDGTFNTKKLVIVTCNDPYKIDSHMTNRPGRMFYYLKYTGVTEEFIREYCADRLNDQTKTQTICTLSKMFYEFNFDMLKALVEELNRYPEESVKQAVELLNINFDYGMHTNYDVSVSKDGVELPKGMFYPHLVSNPIQQDVISITIYGKIKESLARAAKATARGSFSNGEDDSDDYYEADYNPPVYKSSGRRGAQPVSNEEVKVVNELNIEMQSGKIRVSPDLAVVTANEGDYEVIFTKQIERSFDYSRLL